MNDISSNELFIDDVLRAIKQDYMYVMCGIKPYNVPTDFSISEAKDEIQWYVNMINKKTERRMNSINV